MAKFRYVYTDFWTDGKIIEEFTPEDKLFYLYLLTNEHTTQIGVYQITKKQIAFELGYSTESVNALMQRFIEHHKLIRYNSETRELAIKNWGKYNLNKGGKPVMDCVKSELKNVKDVSLIEFVSERVENASLKGLYDTYTIRGQKEKEKEKEKEEEKEEEEREAATPSAPPSVIDNDFLKIKNYFEQHVIYQQCNYKQAQELGNILDDYHDTDLIIEAMKTAVLRSVPRTNYVNGILRGWKADGITNIAQLQAKEVKTHAGNQQPNASYHGRTEEEIAILKQLGSYNSNHT